MFELLAEKLGRRVLLFLRDAALAGVALGVTNVIANRIEAAHDRLFASDEEPDEEITFTLEEPCPHGCTCAGCVDEDADQSVCEDA